MSVLLIHETEKRARNILNASPVPELRSLTIEEDGDVLRLSGTLSRYYHKQLAQETLRRVCREAKLVLRNLVCVE
ncbi:MAG: BON domain-containing protein [Planctomycetia bacterium]|nr:BON domain-containing protein [Planctomycetia bacterium]